MASRSQRRSQRSDLHQTEIDLPRWRRKVVGNCGAVRGRVSFVEWRDSLQFSPHRFAVARGMAAVNVSALCVTGPVLPLLNLGYRAQRSLRTQLCDATDPVWPGEDHATLDHLGLYGRAGCCQSPQGSSPNDEGTGLPPTCGPDWLCCPVTAPPAYRWIHTMYAPKAVRHHVHWQMRSQWNRGFKHDRILVEGGPQGDLAKRLSRNQPCVASGIWTPAAKSRLT